MIVFQNGIVTKTSWLLCFVNHWNCEGYSNAHGDLEASLAILTEKSSPDLTDYKGNILALLQAAKVSLKRDTGQEGSITEARITGTDECIAALEEAIRAFFKKKTSYLPEAYSEMVQRSSGQLLLDGRMCDEIHDDLIAAETQKKSQPAEGGVVARVKKRRQKKAEGKDGGIV